MRGRMLAPAAMACVAASLAWGGTTAPPTPSTQPTLTPVSGARPAASTPVVVQPVQTMVTAVATQPKAIAPAVVHPAPVFVTPVSRPLSPALGPVAGVPVVAAPPMDIVRADLAQASHPGLPIQRASLPAPTAAQVAQLELRWNSIIKFVQKDRTTESASLFIELRPTPADLDVLFGQGDRSAIRRRLAKIFDAEMVYQLRRTIRGRTYTQAVVQPAPDYRFQGGLLSVTPPLYSVVLSRQDSPVGATRTRVRAFAFLGDHWVLIGR